MAAFRRLQEAGGEPSELEMPRLKWGENLIEWLFEVGPGNDGKPITWGEIDAWSRITGITLEPFEGLALRRLSVEYMGEYLSARDAMRPMPYDAKMGMRKEVASGLKEALRAIAKKRKG